MEPSRAVSGVQEQRRREKFSSSEYLLEMSKTTDDRLKECASHQKPQIIKFLDMGAVSGAKLSTVDIDRPLFEVKPTEVIFQKYEPQEEYRYPVLLRNADKYSRHVKVILEDSLYFSLDSSSVPPGKVAPGMEVTYYIVFKPDTYEDYFDKLICTTEREKFIIPIRGIGTRGIVNFSDKINFPKTPVKHTSTKTVLIRNVGTAKAHIRLEAKEPFDVTPKCLCLDLRDQCTQVDILFTPRRAGDHTGELLVHYETGEEVYMMLHASAVEANVTLDQRTVKLANTYITKTSKKSVVIRNRSGVVAHYQWKTSPSEFDEETEQDMRSAQLCAGLSLTTMSLQEEGRRATSRGGKLPPIARRGQENQSDDGRLLFSDDVMVIDPLEGEIWPNSQAEVFITFTPNEATSVSRMAFCDVTGREMRLPLKLKGAGIGPKLQFSLDTLNIKNVYMNTSPSYLVVLENKGHIDGSFSLIPNDSTFGSKFVFTPQKGLLHPGQIQVIQVLFQSSLLGEFCEEFLWNVDKAVEPLKLAIQGKVIGPTFRFNIPMIDFGTVSYGFVNSREVVLCNTSDTPMKFCLRVPNDNQTPDTNGPEFIIQPHKGTLMGNCSEVIKVTLTSYQVQVYKKELVLDVEGVGTNVFSMPIHADAQVPRIRVVPGEVDLGKCLVRYPYSVCVELINDSELSAKFCLQPQVEDNSPVHYTTSVDKGIISSKSCVRISLEFKFTLAGQMNVTLPFIISGSPEPPVELIVRCLAHGPLVSLSPSKLAWGPRSVLTSFSKEVEITNQSLIDVPFICAIKNDRSVFSVSPSNGLIPPYCSSTLTVTTFVDDCIKFEDELVVKIVDGNVLVVCLSVEGQGTTIVSEPHLDGMNMGSHFSTGICQESLNLTNKGRRMQSLSWITQGYSTTKKKRANISDAKIDRLDLARKDTNRSVDSHSPVFKVIPNKFVLHPNQSKVITIKGECCQEVAACERLVCYSSIGHNPRSRKIMALDVEADFICPVLDIVPKTVHFNAVQGESIDILEPITRSVTLKNLTSLPITPILQTVLPFFIGKQGVHSTSQEMTLDVDEKVEVCVGFDPAFYWDRQSETEEQIITVEFKEHKHKDQIKVFATIPFSK